MAETAYAPDPKATADAFLSRRFKCGCIATFSTSNSNASGLIHYWKLQEASGLRLDSVGTRSFSPVGSPTSTAGKRGNAAVIGSVPNRMQTIVSGVFPPTPNYSVSFWLNVVALPVADTRVMVKTVNPANVDYRIHADGTVRFFDTVEILSRPLGLLGKWHLVVLTINGTTWNASVDGEAFVSATGSASPGSNDQLQIAYLDSVLTSYIDEIAVWNVAITQAQVAFLWNLGAGRFLV